MLERRVRDFRIDSRLRRNCQQDIMVLCGMFDSVGGDEAEYSICLQVGSAEGLSAGSMRRAPLA
jgi:hypothetical protein